MKIQIAPPLSLYERGQRSNNEDNLFPPSGTSSADDQLFLVCDGVGGADKGEIASEIVCRAISGYFLQHAIKTSDTQIIGDAIAYAEAELERHKETAPNTARMATTLALLHLHENGASVAHVGDSRVYHIREGRLCTRTQDHSYVNELVKSGIITAEEAPKHPKRNVITRALQGSGSPVVPEVQLLEDLQAGDYFFLCTDGILEALTENELLDILGSAQTDAQKLAKIREKCEAHSRDNFTAYLIRLQSVEHLVVELLTPIKDSHDKAKETDGIARGNPMRPWVMVLALINLLLFSTIAWLIWGKKEIFQEHKPPKPATEIENSKPPATAGHQFSEVRPDKEKGKNKNEKKRRKER